MQKKLIHLIKLVKWFYIKKNFYPVLPNTWSPNYERNQEKKISVNLSNYKYFSFEENSQPDIIIINNGLKPCAKKIRGTVFIN